MGKKLLQLSNDFADQKIYINLVRRLSNKGFKQIIYVPVKWEDKIDGNRDDSLNNVSYYYEYILKRSLFFKLRYHRKLRIIFKNLESKIDFGDVGLVHAHFLFSDGGVAYLLKKKYNIKYIVSVRASDIFTFFRKMPHLRKFGNEIMKEAETVIFINFSYKEKFVAKYLSKSFQCILNKIEVLPNAIDDRWFKQKPNKKTIQNPIRLLYVGRIIKRKKLDVVINAVKILNSNSKHNYVLEVVGQGEGAFMSKIKKMVNGNTNFHGKIDDFSTLLKVYRRSHIFVMPSKKETFGLVYIESLSQGIPIIYCKDEGVDGFFKNKTVGVAVSPDNVLEVVEGVKYIESNYEELSSKALLASERFNWDASTASFIKIYEEAGLRVP